MVIRQLAGSTSGILVALVMMASGTTGCRTDSGCFSDSECGEGKICDDGKCVTGERPGIGDLDLTGDPNQGDPYGADIDVPGDFGPQYDPRGPKIRLVFPRAYELVQNIIMIAAEVNDPDGVDVENVYAIIADVHQVQLTADESTGTYNAPFDTDIIGRMVFPTIQITAQDVAGNTTTIGNVFSLDNEPPRISFTSRYEFWARFGAGGVECTAPISPLGEHTLRNGDIIDSNYYYGLGLFPRLRIEDAGNDDTTQNMPVPVFGVNNSSTFLYTADSQATANNSRKLLLGNGPGTPCSHINPDLMPDPNQPDAPDRSIATFLDHRGDVQGRGDYPLPFGLPNFTPPSGVVAPPLGCDQLGFTFLCVADCCHEPVPLCTENGELFTYIDCYSAPQDPETLETECHPRVYGPGDYSPYSALICSNGGYDALNWVADGVVCLTASAADTRNNLAYAAPIAICVDKDNSGDCIGFSNPNAQALCSDGCTPAEGFGVETDPPQGSWYSSSIYNVCY